MLGRQRGLKYLLILKMKKFTWEWTEKIQNLNLIIFIYIKSITYSNYIIKKIKTCFIAFSASNCIHLTMCSWMVVTLSKEISIRNSLFSVVCKNGISLRQRECVCQPVLTLPSKTKIGFFFLSFFTFNLQCILNKMHVTAKIVMAGAKHN